MSLLNNRLMLDFGTGCVHLSRQEALKLAGDLLARVRPATGRRRAPMNVAGANQGQSRREILGAAVCW
jgi:hypothetical protein